MGFLKTRWEAGHEGHQILVTRNELTKGFWVLVDGVEIGRARWSLAGTGEIRGTFRSGDREVPITAVLKLSMKRAVCEIIVDGAPITVWNLR
ncbi:MAG: hypothetical protein ACKV2T_12445 [Kofleriaceae bacterium]